MTVARISLSLVGVVGVMALALAGATIWLLVTQPVTVANPVAQGAASPLGRALREALFQAFQGLLKYLERTTPNSQLPTAKGNRSNNGVKVGQGAGWRIFTSL